MQYPYGMNFQPQIQVPPQQRHVDRVHGEAGVDAYMMAPNSDVLLLDETAAIIWFVQTDAAGYKSKYPYTITPYEKQPEPDVKGIDERLDAIDVRLKNLEEALK